MTFLTVENNSPAESQKPCRRVGIADRKVFARIYKITNKHQLKSIQVWKVSRLSGKFLGGLESFQIVWKVSRWSEKFPDGPESFHIFWKFS